MAEEDGREELCVLWNGSDGVVVSLSGLRCGCVPRLYGEVLCLTGDILCRITVESGEHLDAALS